MSDPALTWRQAFVRSTPFLCLHAVFLLGTAWQASLRAPVGPDFGEAVRLAAAHLKELTVLVVVYGMVAKLAGKWRTAASTAMLVLLLTLSALYFLVTVKTRVAYGAGYLLDELVHFVLLYGPTYLTPASCAFGFGVLFCLAFAPQGLLVLGRQREWVGKTMLAFACLALLVGTAGWVFPPEGIPEYARRSPLGLLVRATVRDSEYREHTSKKRAEVEKLLEASLGSAVPEIPPELSESAPFEKVILYLMEGVSGQVFDPRSDYAFLLPRLQQWSQHAIQFRHHYTLSTLTFHSYQTISLGGYIRSGSRLETIGADSLSFIKPLVREGFETAFFCATDLAYRGNARFLEDLGYQTVMHYPDFPGSYARHGKVVDDRALVDAFRVWAKHKERFFAVLNPMGTHDPYWNPEGDSMGAWEGNSELRAYLDALHYQDKILGELLDYVDDEYPDALVVILSDHGIREYFSELERADPSGDAFVASFETRFHVPLYFYSRRVFPEGGQSQMLTSHVDLLPTVLDLLGMDRDERALAGSSVLSGRSRVHFLNTQHNLDVLGLLDGSHKFLLERETGSKRLYRLSETGDWERVEGAEGRQGEEYYQELVMAWYRFLTE